MFTIDTFNLGSPLGEKSGLAELRSMRLLHPISGVLKSELPLCGSRRNGHACQAKAAREGVDRIPERPGPVDALPLSARPRWPCSGAGAWCGRRAQRGA